MENKSLDNRLRQTSGGFLLDVLRRRAEAVDAGPDARLRYNLGDQSRGVMAQNPLLHGGKRYGTRFI